MKIKNNHNKFIDKDEPNTIIKSILYGIFLVIMLIAVVYMSTVPGRTPDGQPVSKTQFTEYTNNNVSKENAKMIIVANTKKANITIECEKNVNILFKASDVKLLVNEDGIWKETKKKIVLGKDIQSISFDTKTNTYDIVWKNYLSNNLESGEYMIVLPCEETVKPDGLESSKITSNKYLTETFLIDY